jgi:type IV secretory pathway TrbL component
MSSAFFVEFIVLLKDQFAHAAGDIRPYVLLLIAACMGLELTRKTYRVLILGENAFVLYGTFFLRSAFLIEAILDFPALVTTAYDFAVHVGVLAGGAGLTFASFQDPGAILNQGLLIGDIMLGPAKDQFSVLSPLVGVALFLSWVVFMVSFGVMAITIFVAQVHLIVAVPLLILLLTFSLCGWTAWMSQGVFGWLYKINGKLFLLAMLSSAVLPLVKTIQVSATVDTKEAVLLALAAATIATLFVSVSGLASGILSGHPQMSYHDGLAGPRILVGGAGLAGSLGSGGAMRTSGRLLGRTTAGMIGEVGAAGGAVSGYAWQQAKRVGPPILSQVQTLAGMAKNASRWKP